MGSFLWVSLSIYELQDISTTNFRQIALRVYSVHSYASFNTPSFSFVDSSWLEQVDETMFFCLNREPRNGFVGYVLTCTKEGVTVTTVLNHLFRLYRVQVSTKNRKVGVSGLTKFLGADTNSKLGQHSPLWRTIKLEEWCQPQMVPCMFYTYPISFPLLVMLFL